MYHNCTLEHYTASEALYDIALISFYCAMFTLAIYTYFATILAIVVFADFLYQLTQ